MVAVVRMFPDVPLVALEIPTQLSGFRRMGTYVRPGIGIEARKSKDGGDIDA